jgi:hypothetical protein
LESVFTQLTDKSVAAAMWGNEYLQSKAEILSILPANLAVDVEWLFRQFESIVSDEVSQQDQRKEVLQNIINLIKKNIAPEWTDVQNNQIDSLDMDTIIMPNMCKILSFYSIVSDACPDSTTRIVADDVQVDNANGSNRWKIILIVLWIIVGIFVVLVIIFAVRAKMNQEEESEQLEANEENS